MDKKILFLHADQLATFAEMASDPDMFDMFEEDMRDDNEQLYSNENITGGYFGGIGFNTDEGELEICFAFQIKNSETNEIRYETVFYPASVFADIFEENESDTGC